MWILTKALEEEKKKNEILAKNANVTKTTTGYIRFMISGDPVSW